MDEVSRILKDKKVVLFDFDGTLVDSMGMWGEVDKAILRLHGLPIPDNFTEEFMFPMIPLTEEETAQFFLDYGCKGTVKTILDQIEQLSQEQYEQHIEAKPGAVDLVRALRDKGVKVGLVTAATMPCTQRHDGVVPLHHQLRPRGSSQDRPHHLPHGVGAFRCQGRGGRLL